MLACVTTLQLLAVLGPLFLICLVLAVVVWIRVLDGWAGLQRLVKHLRSSGT